MKYILALITFALATFNSLGQSPDQISYQAIIRANDNSLVTNSYVDVRIIIRAGNINGDIIYQEEHQTITNNNGLISLIIGNETPIIGNFSKIPWSQDSYFIETQVNIDEEKNYNIIGTSQLLSVPYALHAKTAKNISGPNPYKASIISFITSRSIASSDINNTLACTVSSTLTLTPDFTEMKIGDILNIEAHNGAVLTVITSDGVSLNYSNTFTATLESKSENVRFGLIRKSGTNAYIISGQ